MRLAAPDDRVLDVLCLLALFGLVFFVLSESLTQPQRLVLGHDMDQPFNWEAYNRHALASGQLPLWNPYLFSGYPALADIQTGLFYPPNVLLRLLPLTLQSFFSWNLALHLWIMAAGTFALCRQLGISHLAALCAAGGMMLGGATTPRIWVGHLVLIYGSCWMPVVLAAAVRSLERPRLMPAWPFVLALVMQVLAGSVQPGFYTVGIVGLYATSLAIWPKTPSRTVLDRLTPLAQLAVAGGVALGLSAFQVWPLVQLTEQSGRSGGLDSSQVTKGSLGVQHLLTILFPNAFATFQTQFQDGSPGGLWEKSPYASLLLALAAPLALLAPERRRATLFFGAIAIGALAFAFGELLPFYELHHLLMPSFRIPGRLLGVWQIAIAMLGAIGLDALVRRWQWRTRSGAIVAAYLAGIAFASTWLTAPGLLEQLGREGGSAPRVFGTEARIVLAIGLGLLLLPLLRQVTRQTTVALLLAAGLVAVDMSAFAGQFLTISGPSKNIEAEQAFAPLQVGRMLSVCQSKLTPNTMMDLRVPTVDGYNSAYLREYANVALLARGEEFTGRTPPTFPKIGSAKLPERLTLLNFLNVTHVHACGEGNSDFELVSSTESMRVYQNPAALPRAVWVCKVDVERNEIRAARALLDGGFDPWRQAVVVNGDAGASSVRNLSRACTSDSDIQVIARDTPSGEFVADVSTRENGMLVTSEVNYPERLAWVDGQPAQIVRTNLAFVGIVLPPGQHRVELRYVPNRFYQGLALSGVTALVWLVAAILIRRYRSRTGRGAAGIPGSPSSGGS